MSLGNIKDSLYKKEDETESIQPNAGLANMTLESGNIEPAKKRIEDKWEGKDPGLNAEQKKIIKIGMIIAGSILAVFLISIGAYEYKQSSFGENKVGISMTGPSEGESGRMLVFEIKYKNSNRASLKNAELRISYPESFKPEGNHNFKEDGLTTGIFSLGEIKGKGAGEIVFSGKAYNPKGTLIYIKTDLYYTPSNFNSQFIAKNQLGVTVTSSPIKLEIAAPQNISSGDAIDYLISYENIGHESLGGIKIIAAYPDGFSFSKSVPESSEGNNVWNVGNISAGQTGRIVISGKLEGARDNIREASVQAGALNQDRFISYNESQTETKIVASPLVVYQTVNNSEDVYANAGEMLFFSIKYKNEGNIGLRDVIITEQLDSSILDYETLELKKGAFNLDAKMIIWKASDYPELKNLEPGKEGAIDFKIKVKEIFPIKNSNDKNFVISSIAKIDSPDIPTPIEMNKIIAGNKMDIKVNSKIVLDVKGFFGDAVLQNSGPIPPKVGQETTYSIHWKVMNISNDIANARVEAVLPTGVVMTGKISPEDSRLAYNERTNSVVWEIGNMAAGEGVLSAPKEVVFQVKINPSPNQIGNTVELIEAPIFYASDLFTKKELSITGEKKSTLLTEDASIGTNYKVMAQ